MFWLLAAVLFSVKPACGDGLLDAAARRATDAAHSVLN
jgi:hypothetical protein